MQPTFVSRGGFKVKHKNTNTAEFMKEKHLFFVLLFETNKILPVKVEHKKYVVLRHYRYYFPSFYLINVFA